MRNKIQEVKIEKIIITSLFLLFTISLDKKKVLMNLSENFAVFYKYYHYFFWAFLNLYFLKEYLKYIKERKIYNHLLCILVILCINILIYYYFFIENRNM